MAESGNVFALCIVVGLFTSVGSLASRWLIVPTLAVAAAWGLGSLVLEKWSVALIACAALPLTTWLVSLWARRQVLAGGPEAPKAARSRSRA